MTYHELLAVASNYVLEKQGEEGLKEFERMIAVVDKMKEATAPRLDPFQGGVYGQSVTSAHTQAMQQHYYAQMLRDAQNAYVSRDTMRKLGSI
jgi:hypothetical protein